MSEPSSASGDGLRVAVLGEPSGWHMRRLLAALAARGHRGTAVRWQSLTAAIDTSARDAAAGERFLPQEIGMADLVVVRGMPMGGLEEVIFRMDLLGRLAALGTPVVNSPKGLEVAIDKYLSLARLAAAGLPVPRTVVAQDFRAVVSAWRELGRDCVAKPIFGSCGRGIVRIRDERALAAILADSAAAGGHGGVVYLQEFIQHPGWDVRILLVGGDALAIRRLPAAGEWRTNLALGGHAEPYEPPPEWVALARAAARVVDARIAGVDILPTHEGSPVILEVNAVPGWRGLEAALGVDVADRIVRDLERLAVASRR